MARTPPVEDLAARPLMRTVVRRGGSRARLRRAGAAVRRTRRACRAMRCRTVRPTLGRRDGRAAAGEQGRRSGHRQNRSGGLHRAPFSGFGTANRAGLRPDSGARMKAVRNGQLALADDQPPHSLREARWTLLDRKPALVVPERASERLAFRRTARRAPAKRALRPFAPLPSTLPRGRACWRQRPAHLCTDRSGRPSFTTLSSTGSAGPTIS